MFLVRRVPEVPLMSESHAAESSIDIATKPKYRVRIHPSLKGPRPIFLNEAADESIVWLATDLWNRNTLLTYYCSDSMAAVKIIHHTKSAYLSLHQIVERSGHKGNWANRNRGVVLVFCIVFLVVVGIIALFAYRRMLQRKANKESYETTSD
ncbi:hypothetical protein PCG10_010121 [Penicillium crustosum]|uniref:Uncharacterized protein n=1 Tax=Penicillium crustosum TaxID=36656 RepID=A0A9P5GFB6_PENCR|nr:uncharacterized protein N7487_007529 [Penicillium crustosum]KAF7519259.1 hypothetical protein PCG10_010121 [Penicillium crustosum]KAJ5401633.1 hypothetical protein N7487_007529 [Penicillium crustosum]